MELLSPSPPPQPAGNLFSGMPSTIFPHGFGQENQMVASHLPEIAEEAAERVVHVAVGKSMERSIGLLYWTFQQFGVSEISLVHVHRPSPTIPTLLGKLPASQANEELVSAYRREEMEQTKKILFNYLSICYRAKVKASIVFIEAGQVQKGIIELVSRYSIRKLVMGAAPDNCMKVKRTSTKANYIAKNAPPFCEIWFVNKGKHVWTREASEGPSSPPPLLGTPETALSVGYTSKSSFSSSSEPDLNLDCLRSSSSTTSRFSRNSLMAEPNEREAMISTTESNFTDGIDSFDSQSAICLTNSTSGLTWASERKVSSKFNLKMEEKQELDFLYDRLIEAEKETDKSKEEALVELLKCKKMEAEAAKAINRIKASEVASAHELELRKEVEIELRTTKQEHEKLSGQRDEAMRELEKTMRNLAILDGHAREASRRRDEATGELKLIQASVLALRQEKKKMRRQREEAVRQLERWRIRSNGRARNYDIFVGFIDDSSEFTTFSVSDLQTATCDFSESFKIGQGSHGCVYKGEMLDRSVAIKKLHPHNMQGRSEFQQEVQVLSKLKHPHLVSLIGACLEAWSLVYEYIPNGSLHDCLFRRTNVLPLTWKIRTRIAAEIASALLFLHSSKPEKIVHGDLKPENILFDSDFNCKIGDFGISRLLPEDTVRCPSFRQNTEPKGAFSYTDPEFQRSGELTAKSDVYSFGIIVLQLLTGRPPLGLATEVRRAMSYGKLSSVLDPLAGEWPTFVTRRLADLGIQCSEVISRDRPELTPALVRELERLHVAEERAVPPYFLCPILHEIMHDPQVAADGFTYEGEALRGWLENGHDTSPMTNLKLSHLDLTPNRVLKSAIQDWLCQS